MLNPFKCLYVENVNRQHYKHVVFVRVLIKFQ